MGQAATLVLGAAGAVIGGVLSGGSLFAIEAGFLAGQLLGSILFAPKPPSPADVRVMDSAYGKWIPLLWGRYRLSGNVIWAGTPHSHNQGGGKGMAGGKGANQTYVTMSFAVALCAGPIDSIQRIWANGKLIYDTSNPADWQSISGSTSMVTGFTVYKGDEDQLADPVMESQLGAGNVPAYRGMAYVVFNELNLQQWGNFLPSLSFEVLKDSTSYTVQAARIAIPNYAYPIINPGLGTRGSFCCKIQPDGTAYGFKGYSNSGSGTYYVWVPWKATPYGVTNEAPITTSVFNDLLAHAGYSYDAPGALIAGGGVTINGAQYGFVEYPGTYLQCQGGTGVANSFTATVWVKRKDVIIQGWIGIANGLSFTTVSRTLLPPPPPLSVTPPERVTPTAATDNYVYCIGSSGALYQYDYGGNLKNTWTGLHLALGTIGYAVSDGEIYLHPVTGGGNVMLWTGEQLLETDLQPGNSGLGSVMAVGPGAVTCTTFASENLTAFTLGQASATPQLADIADEVLMAAGLQAGQYSTTSLTDVVLGYASTNNSSARNILSPLLSTYFVDVSDADAILKFVRRGASPVSTIPWDDLGADESQSSDGAVNPIQESIQQEFELPRSETISYVSASTDYQTLTQRAFKANTVSNLDESLSVPIVLDDGDARMRAEAVLWERWAQQRTFQFKTGYKYLAVEPSDVVYLEGQSGQKYPVRITKTDADGKGTITFTADFAVPQIYPNPGAPTYIAVGGAAQGVPTQKVDYSGPTELVVMDVPPLRPQDATSAGVYVAACGLAGSWPGCALDISRDDVNFTQVTSITSASAIGKAQSVLGAFAGGNIPDELNAVTIQLFEAGMSLASVGYDSFLNGANAAYLGGELIYFRNATQVDAVTWTVSGLLRGRVGTGSKQASHNVGDLFVLLDQTKLAAVDLNLQDLGQNIYLDAYLNNLFNATASGTATVQPTNMRFAALAPHLLQASKGSSASLNDILVHWHRQARINCNWVDGTDVPLDWQQESYRIIVYSGTTQKNAYTLAASGVTWNGGTTPQATPVNPANQALPPFAIQPVFVYTAAMISNDGFSAGQTITIAAQQIGDYGVPGQIASTTINR
ncbi:phage tail protein [Paraburkholderia caballeronis]|uniref:phage tail protein n=1 Tax=Paraburkholderia caballeronis TaxID=416943 RepID=UPI001066D6D8|nr:phage tail protein [Paraburkholderia caballeronis]TDV04695.1 putative tail protein [Paraburkholderia caballeronis]TDV07938.1 putative tail protein [Paraburkholderia caballeronis]TDV18229.1 putative tail protein [Paraburkholderia caballeronis]